MSWRSFSFFVKTTTLGFTAWTLIFTREIPSAFAQAPIETDCSTELDQPDTTYILNANVPGNCVIAADNITLDGQNLYTVGDIFATTTATVNFTVQNVTVNDDVSVYLGSAVYYAAGNVTVINSVVGNTVHSYSYNYNAGDVTVIDSEIGGDVYSRSYSGNMGSVTVQNSTTGEVQISSNAEGNGEITISESVINGSVRQGSSNNQVTITDSTINSTDSYAINVNGSVALSNSTINQSGGYYYSVYADENVEVSNSVINTDAAVSIAGDECVITDTVFTQNTVYCSTITLTDTAPSLTVTPLTLELESGDTFNPFEDAFADDIVDGDISDEIIVVGEVGEGPGTYELVYSVTDLGTTLINDFDDSTATSGPSTTSLTRTVIRPEEGGSESTRVGARSSSSGDKNISTTAPTTGSQNMDEILVQLKTALSQPINTNDPATLKKLLGLLLQLMAAIAQLSTLK